VSGYWQISQQEKRVNIMDRKAHMNTWGSVITHPRAKALGRIIHLIAQASKSPINRQVGNVINDLRNLGEHGLIDELKRCIDAYNQEVDEFNQAVDFTNAVKVKLARYKRGERYQDAYDHAFPGRSIWGMAAEYNYDAYEAIREFELEYTRR
jgi:hypothetical protein